MIQLDAILKWVRPDVPNCPEPTLMRALRASVEDFCRQTWIWRTTLDELELEPGEREYTLTAPRGARICAVVEMLDTESRPFTAFSYNLPIILLDTEPMSAKVVYPTVALQPDGDTYTEVQDLFWDWREGLAAGAKARLFEIPGKSWSSPEQAAFAAGLFRTARNKARVRVLHGNQTKPQRVAPMRFV